MSYRIYHTEAIVLGSYNRNDASKSLQIYTKDLGLIYVHAQGLRKLESKLRYGLQYLSHSHISVVRGKHMWRVIESHPVDSFKEVLLRKKPRDITANIVVLLGRLLDEGDQGIVFKEVVELFQQLKKVKQEEVEDIVETITLYRILFHLGYIQPEGIGEHVVMSPWSKELYAKAALAKPQLIVDINQGLRETQL